MLSRTGQKAHSRAMLLLDHSARMDQELRPPAAQEGATSPLRDGSRGAAATSATRRCQPEPTRRQMLRGVVSALGYQPVLARRLWHSAPSPRPLPHRPVGEPGVHPVRRHELERVTQRPATPLDAVIAGHQHSKSRLGSPSRSTARSRCYASRRVATAVPSTSSSRSFGAAACLAILGEDRAVVPSVTRNSEGAILHAGPTTVCDQESAK